MKRKGVRINDKITSDTVRLIDENAKMIGVIALGKALSIAKGKGLDLVEIVAESVPPLCKLMDYGRYFYEQKRKKTDARKKQKKTCIKEIKFGIGIAVGDFNVKINKIKEIIADGDKVKVSMQFTGREIVHKELGEKLFSDILDALADVAKVELEPRFEGKYGSMLLSSIV